MRTIERILKYGFEKYAKSCLRTTPSKALAEQYKAKYNLSDEQLWGESWRRTKGVREEKVIPAIKGIRKSPTRSESMKRYWERVKAISNYTGESIARVRHKMMLRKLGLPTTHEEWLSAMEEERKEYKRYMEEHGVGITPK